MAGEVNVDGKMGVAYRIAAGAGEMGGNGGGRDEATQGLPTFGNDNGMAGMRHHALMMNMRCINMTRDLTRAHTNTKDDSMEHQGQKTMIESLKGAEWHLFNVKILSPIPVLLGKHEIS